MNKDVCDCHPVVRPKVFIAENAGKTISMYLFNTESCYTNAEYRHNVTLKHCVLVKIDKTICIL